MYWLIFNHHNWQGRFLFQHLEKFLLWMLLAGKISWFFMAHWGDLPSDDDLSKAATRLEKIQTFSRQKPFRTSHHCGSIDVIGSSLANLAAATTPFRKHSHHCGSLLGTQQILTWEYSTLRKILEIFMYVVFFLLLSTEVDPTSFSYSSWPIEAQYINLRLWYHSIMSPPLYLMERTHLALSTQEV